MSFEIFHCIFWDNFPLSASFHQFQTLIKFYEYVRICTAPPAFALNSFHFFKFRELHKYPHSLNSISLAFALTVLQNCNAGLEAPDFAPYNLILLLNVAEHNLYIKKCIRHLT